MGFKETDYDNNKQCFKCKSTNIEFKEMKKSKCNCKAKKHFRKKCKSCGYVSYIHRHIVDNEFLGIGG